MDRVLMVSGSTRRASTNTALCRTAVSDPATREALTEALIAVLSG